LSSNNTRHRDIASLEKHTTRPTRLSRATTEQLLDGHDGPAPLVQLLAAATMPATATELRGEPVALAAFTSPGPTNPLPHETGWSTPTRASTLSRIMVAKAIAGLVLTASAGGVALAATSTSLPDDQREAAVLQESAPVAGPGDYPADTTSSVEPAPEPDASDSQPAGPAETDAKGLIGLCQAWSAGATANNGEAAASPAFTTLSQAAGGEKNIDSYCAAIRTERTASERLPTPPGKPGQDTDPGKDIRQPAERQASPPSKAQDKPQQANGSANDADQPGKKRNTTLDRPTGPSDNARAQSNNAGSQH
jgi:hypothetical protein